VILESLGDVSWTDCTIAVAFAKLSGTSILKGRLRAFSDRAHLTILVGVDREGTSKEALEDLLEAAGPRGTVLVCHNAVRRPFNPTFHPKIYIFESATCARLIVGSVNLTRGGLFENYEASVVQDLDLNDPADAAALAEARAAVESWSSGPNAIARPLTAPLISQLVDQRIVKSEQAIASERRRASADSEGRERELEDLFSAVAERGAPFARTSAPVDIARAERIARGMNGDDESPEPATESEPEVPSPSPTPAAPLEPVPRSPAEAAPAPMLTYIQTLHQTDVGFGQTTPNTSARSPEIFVPIAAAEAQPAFWNYRSGFRVVTGKPHILTRGIKLRFNGRIQDATLMIDDVKRDLRLRSSAVRNAAHLEDLLVLHEVGGTPADYDVVIVPRGSPTYVAELGRCVNRVRPPSQKRWGYY